ncbi:hypothetical protein R1flu_006451 [Riccia fluitans]|uniref:PUB 62/63 C-terminal domain-containing protein n=1 Tax=Riccia fluitans TaxID=41844 RepID=A0ABD1Z046_9MARC
MHGWMGCMHGTPFISNTVPYFWACAAHGKVATARMMKSLPLVSHGQWIDKQTVGILESYNLCIRPSNCDRAGNFGRWAAAEVIPEVEGGFIYQGSAQGYSLAGKNKYGAYYRVLQQPEFVSENMAAMTMHMPSMVPPGPSPPQGLRPASPGNAYQHQALSGSSHMQAATTAGIGQASAASNLSLGLPIANNQGASNTMMNSSNPKVNAVPSPSDGSMTLTRVKLVDMLPEDGAPSGVYTRTVENLTASLIRHNAAIIELSGEDAALVRCALESAKLYFRSRVNSGGQVQSWNGPDKFGGYVGASSRGLYFYRAGVGGRSNFEESEPPPPGMPEVYRCLGKASRASLSAIARQLRLRSDVFGHMLDDSPLPSGEVSSSVLTATSYHPSGGNGKPVTLGEASMSQEVEKGLLMLIATDTPGLQVCDPSGRWFLADNGVGPGDLILLTGKALQHATAGIRKASTYRVVPLSQNHGPGSAGRTSLAFRLVPRDNATIDCTPMQEAGHAVPENFGPISVAAFMDNLLAAEALTSNGSENSLETLNASTEPSLRSCLTDPLSGEFLEDAMVAQCGHTYGGLTLRKVYETLMCTLCNAAVEGSSLIPNIALREAAKAYKREAYKLQFRNPGSLKPVKRRREIADQPDPSRPKRPNNKENPSSPTEKENAPRSGAGKGVQYPFSVNERVMIKGNKRTPEKFVGREAHITSQCLNGWYLLKTLDNGESVRLQYRSLQKTTGEHNGVGEDNRVHGSHQ